jgi:GNAT superfamily N-acetyltransferase
MRIRRATLEDLDLLVPLFDGYRQFYAQPSDPLLAREFLSARLQRGESVVLLASDAEGRAMGFAQLYPTFCSVAAARIFTLYDLFICPEARRGGVGASLLRVAADFARSAGAVRLELSTARTNQAAQALYEREGWRRVDEFEVYALPLAPPGA